MTEQQRMKEMIDTLRSVLEQRMGPEEAAQFKPKHMDFPGSGGI